MSPWVRIQENALDHPKLLGLVDCRRPFDLWVWGLSYTQKHLTDGALPAAALPRGADKAAAALVARGLWSTTDAGYQVHDYLQWNDSRAKVEARRAKNAQRLADWRAKHGKDNDVA